MRLQETETDTATLDAEVIALLPRQRVTDENQPDTLAGYSLAIDSDMLSATAD